MRTLFLAVLLLSTPCLFSQPGLWTPETAAAPWIGRHMQRTIVFDGKMWVIGGYNNAATSYTNDIWTSTDGVNWTQVITGTPMWSPRRSHGVAVFNNKLWVIGGADGVSRADVWSSTDGATWFEETAAAQWPVRSSHTTVVYDNKLWVLGGFDGAGKNDVWSSVDGVTWVASPTAPWSARYHHMSVVFDNKMWVMGGSGGSNEIWWSTNGTNWTQAPFTTTRWSARFGFTLEVFDGRMWVLGGSNLQNDVWSSPDGESWTLESAAAPWSGRRYVSGAVLDSRLWVMAGYDGVNSVNDVWSYEGPPFITSTPALTTPVGGLYTYDVVVAGYPAPTISVSGLPAWLTRTGDTLSGTPTSIGMTGPITVTATNTSGVDTQIFQIDVQGVPPQITSAPVTDATAGSLYSYTVTATGEPAPALSAGTLPGWLAFNPTTGELSGTPTAPDVGSSPAITITAANGWQPDAVQNFAITVVGVAPQITSTPVLSVTAGQLYSYTVTATGIPAPVLAAGTLPSWLNFDTISGELSGTPPGTAVGLTSVTITASNGTLPDAVQNFDIDVLGIAPVFTSTPVLTATPTKPYSYIVEVTGAPDPVLSAGTLPAWLSLNTTTGELSGTPPTSAAKTSVAVTLTATNGTTPDAQQAFTIEIGKTPGTQTGDNGGSGGCSAAGATPLMPPTAVLLACLARRRRRD